MASDVGMRSPFDIRRDIETVLREQWKVLIELNDHEREARGLGSGTAPPAVEGSPCGFRGKNVVAEEELVYVPDYVSYINENVNLNPGLAPPLWEDLLFSQPLKGAAGGSSSGGAGSGSSVALGGIGDQRKERIDEQPRIAKVEDIADRLIGLQGLELGSKGKSIAEVHQGDIGCSTSTSKCPSRLANHAVDVAETSKSRLAYFQPDLSSLDTLHSRANIAGMSSLQNVVSSGSRTCASASGTLLARNNTPESQHIGTTPSPRIPPVGGGKMSSLENQNIPTLSDDILPCKTEPMDLVAGLSGMRLSVNNMVDEGNHPKPQIHPEIDNQRNFLNLLNEQNHVRQHSHLNMSGTLPSGGIYLKGPSTPTSGGSSSLHPNADSQNFVFSGYALGGYGMNPPSPPSMLTNQLEVGNLPYLYNTLASGTAGVDFQALGGGLNMGPNFLLAADVESQNLSRVGTQSLENSMQNHLMDPLYLQSLRSNEYSAALNDPTINRAAQGNSHMDLLELQKAYISELISSQRSQYDDIPCSRAGVSYPGSPFTSQVLPNSPYGVGSPFSCGERNMPFRSGTRSSAGGGVMGARQSDQVSNVGGNSTPSLLDEFKMNRTRCFALSEIDSHVIEFCSDQYGSQFIQQKLETATIEEKNMVFREVIPHALSLMTDVFGNYVIQKFFELGTSSQIRKLTGKLSGNVLTLSLQMYGCRVIQKAIEVFDLEQKIAVISELDGHIMRCARDQNGNHVIQKCIECLPEDAIQFVIIALYDQVVTLSTHPYGCRIIQRVLEHCHSPETQSRMLKEILQSVSLLAQDQFGNYVVQHLLEHGRPDERSLIIGKLSGQIVHMSQQKFASNVVEKCLTFGTPEERRALVNEMLGSTGTNDSLQVLMKDQFANYVVQKVLETCDDGQLELILRRIKVHMNALRKYTYGKHIVARLEKLVAAGERRIGFLSSRR